MGGGSTTKFGSVNYAQPGQVPNYTPPKISQPQAAADQAKAVAAALAAQQNSFSTNGAPARPAYQNPLMTGPGPNGTTNYGLPANYQVQYNNDALNYARSYANAPGPSPWASMKTAELDAGLPGQQAQLNSQLGGANTVAKQGLMGEGGLSNAASARFDRRANLAQMMGGQNLGQQNELNKQGILSTDAQEKQTMLNAMPGLENQALAPQQFNIQKVIDQNHLANLDSVEKYKTDMAGWTAANTSQAYNNSGKK